MASNSRNLTAATSALPPSQSPGLAMSPATPDYRRTDRPWPSGPVSDTAQFFVDVLGCLEMLLWVLTVLCIPSHHLCRDLYIADATKLLDYLLLGKGFYSSGREWQYAHFLEWEWQYVST